MRTVQALGVALALASGTAAGQEMDRLAAEARAQASRLTQELGAQLKQELARGGPEAAITVCKDAAPEIASRLSRESGARIARVSLKTRNPLLGTPDAWEQTVLADFDRRAASGTKPETLEAAEIVAEPQGRYFRYMKAIPVQPLCLACHGSEAALAPAVRDGLRTAYPHDRATGYETGMIRGAVSVRKLIVD